MTGEFLHTVDTKGRLFIPAKLREELGFNFVLTKGLDNSLAIYPEDEWKKFSDKICSIPTKKSMVLRRFFMAPAQECSPDVQGRVLIPQTLREYAELDKNVIVIGMGNHIQIWDVDKWKAIEPSSEQVGDIMDEEGI